jgi:hypothetical protein
MVGLLLLKQLENLSDERVVLQFKRNPYLKEKTTDGRVSIFGKDAIKYHNYILRSCWLLEFSY